VPAAETRALTRIKENGMKKHGLALFVILSLCAVAVLLFSACQNPHMVHNLERPVYLTGIEIRSDRLDAADPSHPLDQVFRRGETSYTVTVPYNAENITVNGIPEEGAEVKGERNYKFELGEQRISVTVTVQKEYRLSTVYNVVILRGLPDALLAGLELYMGEDDPDGLGRYRYENDNYIVNFVPARGVYSVKLPAYTNNLAILAQSYISEENRVSLLSYEFKNHEGKTVGAGGKPADLSPGYHEQRPAGKFYAADLPAGFSGPVLEWGDFKEYPGGPQASAYPDGTWFGTGTIDPANNPALGDKFNPFGQGRKVIIEITASSEKLNPKKYTLEIEREPGAAYLDKLEVFKISGADLLGPVSAGVSGSPEADAGAATVDNAKNRIVGNFTRTILNYEAVIPMPDPSIPKDANAVRILPSPDSHIVSPRFTYVPYYYRENGERWYVDTSGDHHLHEKQLGDIDPFEQEQSAYKFIRTGYIDFFFRDTADFSAYTRMEVVIGAEDAGNINNEARVYRVNIYRKASPAVLNFIEVYPYAPANSAIATPGIIENVFGPPANDDAFSPQKTFYTVNVAAGITHARLKIDNDGVVTAAPPAFPPISWTADSGNPGREISVFISGAEIAGFRRVHNGSVYEWWDNYNNNLGNHPYLDAELTGRNTMVQIQVKDIPAYTTNEYILNILSKNTNDIILPLDEFNDGRVSAVFADGANKDLPAQRALPGELIKLTVDANLGYYIDWRVDPYDVPGGRDGGVHADAATLSMGIAGVRLISDPGNWKHREYLFSMPDENVEFFVDYKTTVDAVKLTAYVAAGAKRSGGFGSGPDGETGASWGKASNDLQAVINSYNGSNFSEIWVHAGTYIPPEPEVYEPDTRPSTAQYNCFSSKGAAPSTYNVNGYAFSNIKGKEDIAFVLRPGIRILGGFLDTDDSKDGNRKSDPVRETILSGEFLYGGARAYHVVLAAETSYALLDTLTIAGGIGPVEDTGGKFTVNGRTIDRTNGAGIYNVNSRLELSRVTIRNNTSTNGAGLYAVANGKDATMDLYDMDFNNNTARESGGGMYSQSLSGTCRIAIGLSSFSNNRSVNRGGGYYNGGGDTSINDSSFTANAALEGGGVFTSGGNSRFTGVAIKDNWTRSNGSGIYNGSDARFYNVDIQDNIATGGSGVGIFNSGTLRMTNATIKDNNKGYGSAIRGGGLANTGTALISNVTIEGNRALTGGGVFNQGRLILANGIIRGNTAGGGFADYVVENGSHAEEDPDFEPNTNASTVLINVSLTGNTGYGMYNEYEGSAQNNEYVYGSLNVLLANVLIAGNTSHGIHNRYSYYSGLGINLTLNNVTIANNTGHGVYTEKAGPGERYPYPQASGADTEYGDPAQSPPWPAAPAYRRAFPVYIRFRNSVVYGNSLTTDFASVWNWNSFGPDSHQPYSRETYEYSLLQGTAPPSAYNTDAAPLPAYPESGTHNLAGTVNPELTADYRPGDVLKDKGSAALYPNENTLDSENYLFAQLFWKIGNKGGNYGGFTGLVTIPVFVSQDAEDTEGAEGKNIFDYFLAYDNSFNVGDLRFYNGWKEGPTDKTRPGSLDIGAYEQ
jgi:hypothetical protein